MPAVLSSGLLYLSILVIAVCGIIYELLIGAVSSYLWGDSVFYFSVTIGLYMSAMGLGAFLSKYIQEHLFDWFVLTELIIALVGGVSALLLFWIYASSDFYEYGMVFITVVIGTMVGMEIPLLVRILEGNESLRQNVAHVLSYDYLGGLIGSVVFPLLLLPYLGIIRTAVVLGLTNLGVVVLNLVRHQGYLRHVPLLGLGTAGVAALLAYLLVTSEHQTQWVEQKLYRDQVIATLQTPYQHLTLTQWHHDIRLFIDGNLQFSSLDEYRYHEALIHVPLSVVRKPQRVLILGGGDGLAVREVLRHTGITEIKLVDIDPQMTALAQTNEVLKQLNQGSLSHPLVKVVHQDAYKFVEHDTGFYDLIVVDLPDPNQVALAKLYSLEFYHLLKHRLSYKGALVTQSTSPFFARETFWCIAKTMAQAGLKVVPYHAEVPSFGDWGFQLATMRAVKVSTLQLPKLATPYRFITPALLPTLFVFGEDLKVDMADIAVNTLIQPMALQYYKRGWEALR